MNEDKKVMPEEETKTIEVPEKKKKKEKTKHEEEILKLTEMLGAEKEKSMRIQAEMMNFKKRKEDEVLNIRKYANEDILKSLLAISDNFERALLMENDENREFLAGFKMIHTSILNILEANDVKEIDCLNKAFDPALEQAVITEHHDDVAENQVLEVLQKGYMYKDRVLRVAMVKVSN